MLELHVACIVCMGQAAKQFHSMLAFTHALPWCPYYSSADTNVIAWLFLVSAATAINYAHKEEVKERGLACVLSVIGLIFTLPDLR
jgi:hypothetical protein